MQKSLGGYRGCLGGKTPVSSAVGRQRAVTAPYLHKKLVSTEAEPRPSKWASTKPVTFARGHNQPDTCRTACCEDERIQKVLEKTLQVCRLLAAATAASLALQTAPALSSEAPRTPGTLTIDRAWMEELIVKEMDTRISNMSDEELLAAFKEVLRARNPATSSAAGRAGPLTFLERLPEQIKGLKLNWPWRPEPAPAEGRAAQMGSLSTEDSSAEAPNEPLSGSSSAQATKAGLSQGELDSPRETESVSRTAQGLPAPGLDSMSPSSQPAPSAAEPGGGTSQSYRKQQGEPAASQSSRKETTGQAQDAGQGAVSPEAEDMSDQTGSLLEASGLPFQLQEGRFPVVASDPPRPGTGLGAAGGALRGAAAAVTGALAAAAAKLKELLLSGQDARSWVADSVPEAGGQIAALAGLLGGLYLLVQQLPSNKETESAEPTAEELPSTEMPNSEGDNGVLASFVTSLRLLPTLLGFPIGVSRPDSIIAAPDKAPSPGQAVRPEQLSYKGAMLDGLHASRMLHKEQAPEKPAASWQGQLQAPLPQAARGPSGSCTMISGDVAETAATTFVCFSCRPSHRPAFILLSVMSRASGASSLLSKAHGLLLPGHQALSGVTESEEPGVLWMRSDPGRSDSPRPAPGAPAEPAGGSILWQRGADGPLTSLEFPRGQQDMPDNRMEGDVGQVGPRRHISRSSALLDNVAPAGVPLPQRLPGRQPHVNGSRSQDRASAASEVTEPDEDPWTATRADLSSSENSGADSPAEWIALHDTLQRGDEDLWRNDQVSAGQHSGATSGVPRDSSQLEGPTATGKSDLYSNVEVLR